MNKRLVIFLLLSSTVAYNYTALVPNKWPFKPTGSLTATGVAGAATESAHATPFTLRSGWFWFFWGGIGYGIAGTYGQHNIISGMGKIDCTFFATTAAGYFLYRHDWNNIDDDELTAIAASSILGAYQYRRQHEEVGMIHADSLDAWHNEFFGKRKMAKIADAAEIHEILSNAITAGTAKLLHDIQNLAVIYDQPRICMTITFKNNKTSMLGYDKNTNRWMLYDSHHRPGATSKDLAGSTLYVFNANTDLHSIAGYISDIINTKDNIFDMVIYAQTPGLNLFSPTRATDGLRRNFNTALQLFAQEKYLEANTIFRDIYQDRTSAF